MLLTIPDTYKDTVSPWEHPAPDDGWHQLGHDNLRNFSLGCHLSLWIIPVQSLSASATTSVMHPAVKKLYGKTVRMPASATISKLDPDPIANKSVKEEPGTQVRG